MRLKEFRERSGETQEQIGRLLGRRQNTIHQYETGKRNISIAQLVKLAEHWNTTIDEIVKSNPEEYS